MGALADLRTASLPRGAEWLLAAVAVEAALVSGYFLFTPAQVTVPRYVVYPFVWINAVAWAALRTDRSGATGRARWVALAVAAGYFLVLGYVSGLFGLVGGHHHDVPHGLYLGRGSPGWSRVRLVTHYAYVSVVPFRLVGYLGLAYLVYHAVADATGAALSGALGLLACVTCSFPVLASLATSAAGGVVTLMSTVYAYSVDISTVAFLVSVALLYWRPGFPSTARGGAGDGDGGDDPDDAAPADGTVPE